MGRPRPGLRQALAAIREGDTLIVTALVPLARSTAEAHRLPTQLSTAGVTVQIGEECNPPIRRSIGRFLDVLALTVDLQVGLGAA